VMDLHHLLRAGLPALSALPPIATDTRMSLNGSDVPIPTKVQR
jgi:hypothetical protein